MAYYDEKKHASDAYRTQVDTDPRTRPPETPKGRRNVMGWLVALIVVAALVIGVSIFGADEAPDAGAPAAMAPAEETAPPALDAPAGTAGETANPGLGD